MVNYYKFANHIFKIDTLYEYFSLYAKEYIVDEEAEYSISNTLEEIVVWKESHNEEGELNYLEILLIQDKVAKLLAKDNIFIMHGSSLYINDDQHGYIYTGPSGVGKSTHVSLLKKRYKDKLVIINDDKPFISLINNNYYIYGSPWSGKSHISSNTCALLKAVFILEQSKDNELIKLDVKEATSRLFKQIYIPKGIEETNKGLDILINIIKDIPIYLLKVNLSNDATDYMSTILKKE